MTENNAWEPQIKEQDLRRNNDITVNELIIKLQQPIRYNYRYNRITGQHSLRFYDVWRYYTVSKKDRSTNLFSVLLNSNEEIKTVVLDRELDILRQTVVVPIFNKVYSPDVLVSLLLFWSARYFDYYDIWYNFILDPELYLYTIDSSPLYKFLNQPETCSRQYLILPSIISDIGQSRNISAREVWWFRNNEIPIQISSLLKYTVGINCWVAFHLSFSWNHVHSSVLYNREDVILYLRDKIVDTILVQEKIFSSTEGPVQRICEGVALYGPGLENDEDLKYLRVLGCCWIPSSLRVTWKDTTDVSSILYALKSTQAHINNYVRGYNVLFSNSGIIGILQPFEKVLSEDFTQRWNMTVILQVDIKLLESLDIITLQKEEPIIWGNLPLGMSTNPIFTEGYSRISNSVVNLRTKTQSNFNFKKFWGVYALYEGNDNENRNHEPGDELYREGLDAYLRGVDNNAYAMKDANRFTYRIQTSLDRLRSEVLLLKTFVKPSILSIDSLSLAVLLKGRAGIVNGQYVLPLKINKLTDVPEIDTTPQKLNNSTIKEINVFLTLLKEAGGIIWDDGHDIKLEDLNKNFKVIFYGVISGETLEILGKVFRNASVLGQGAETTRGGGVRTNIFEGFTTNTQADYVISDIDQSVITYDQKNFDQMVEFLVSMSEQLIISAPNVAIKVNFPVAFVLNSMYERILTIRPNSKMRYIYVSGQNTLTTEVYVLFYGNEAEKKWLNKDAICSSLVTDNEIEFQTNRRWDLILLDKLPSKSNITEVTDFLINLARLIGITVSEVDANNALIQMLTYCSKVTTWKTNRSSSEVNMIGVPDLRRMSITLRTPIYYDLSDIGKSIGAESFGISTNIQDISFVSTVSWYTFVNLGCRYWMKRYGALFFSGFERKVVVIGSRDFGELLAGLGHEVEVYDKYTPGVRALEKYNIKVNTEFWDYKLDIIERDTMYLFNFVIMAPHPQNGTPTAETQLQHIHDLALSLKNVDGRSLIMISIYTSDFLNELDFYSISGSFDDLIIARTVTPPTIKVGAYDPVEMLTIGKVVDEIKGVDGIKVYTTYVKQNYLISAGIENSVVCQPSSIPQLRLFSNAVTLIALSKS